MIFLTNNDILAKIDQGTLDDITEQDNTILDAAEAEAIAEMTGYLNTRYDPVAIFAAVGGDRNAEVVMRCADITLYHLHTRISPDNIPELREKRYNGAVGWLEKLANGFINPVLPVKEDLPNTPIRYGNSIEKDDLYY